MKRIILLLFAVLLLSSCAHSPEVTDFESCIEAGFPIMESDPRQCRGPTGELFVEEKHDNTEICEADIKVCPDGTYIRRDPLNNCEFNACPEVSNVTS